MCCHQHRYAQLTEKIKSSHRLQQKNGQMMQLCHISYSNANMALKHGHLILLNTRCLDSSLSSCLFLASSAHITGRRDRNAREGGEDENRGRRFERSLTFFFSPGLAVFLSGCKHKHPPIRVQGSSFFAARESKQGAKKLSKDLT